MRCGILIIGSLLWDKGSSGRENWRKTRLQIRERIPVAAPIYYGRKSQSRGDTFTMTFKSGAPTGRAVLAPCKCETETINDLIFEAQALWNAEAPKSSQNAIGSVWGCVGVLFKNDRIRETLATGWSTYFKQMRSHGLSVVNSEGLLNIVWPTDMAGEPVDVDIILATATTPKILPPTAGEIANAWMNQSNGHEHYFFENVHHGIRTDADTEIWRCIERGNPPWLTLGIQKEMAVKLNSEA